MLHVQFLFDLDTELPENERSTREYIAERLRKAAEEVVMGGKPAECGASHIHEIGEDWTLQID